MFDHQRLGDHSPEGEGEDVDGVETECGDERVGVIGHRLDGDGDGAWEAPTPRLSKAMT